MRRLEALIRKIHRRSLWQVTLIYLGSAWAVLQVADQIVQRLALPEWIYGAALVLLVAGLPIVLATAFVQEPAPGEGRGDAERTTPSGIVPPDAESRVATADRIGPDRESRASASPRAGTQGTLREIFTWRNALAGGVIAFALWGAVATGWLFLSDHTEDRSAVGTAEVSPNRVAVLPFGVRGTADLAYLGEGLVTLLATKLDGTGELRTVDARAVLSVVQRREPQATLDPERARSVARNFGAGLYVLGDVLEAGGRLRIDASLYDTSDAEPVGHATASGETGQVFDMVDRLAGQLLGEQLVGPGRRIARVAAVTTHSLPAFRAYLEGEKAFRAGRFEAAEAAFQEAVSADSTFALAYYRLSITEEWLIEEEAEQRAAEQAIHHSDRLSEHDRRLLEATLARKRAEVARAESLFREIVSVYPADIEAWFQLGEVLFHYGPPRGRPIGASRNAWEQVLRYEPDHLPSLVHLARIAAVQGRRSELDSLTRAAIRLEPGGSYALYTRVLRAFAFGDTAAQRAVTRELRDATENTRRNAVWTTTAFGGDVEGALRLRKALDAHRGATEENASTHVGRAYLQLARGRRRAATRAMSELGEGFPLAFEHRVLLSLHPFLEPPTRPELEAMRDTLLARTGTTGTGPVSPGIPPLDLGLTEHVRLYLAGLLSAEMGDVAEAFRFANDLEAREPPEGAGSVVHDLAQGIRAEAQRAQGHTERALAALRRMRQQTSYLLLINSPLLVQDRERYLRARHLERRGELREALRWYGSFEGYSTFSAAYFAPSHLRRAEIHERLGEPEAALHHYRRFVELWEESDPELRPQVEAARKKIEALAGSGAESAAEGSTADGS